MERPQHGIVLCRRHRRRASGQYHRNALLFLCVVGCDGLVVAALALCSLPPWLFFFLFPLSACSLSFSSLIFHADSVHLGCVSVSLRVPLFLSCPSSVLSLVASDNRPLCRFHPAVHRAPQRTDLPQYLPLP